MGRVTGFEPAGEPAFRLPSRQRPIVRASGAKRPLVQLARRKKESPYSLQNTDLKYRNSIDANASRFLPKTKSKPSAAGSIWKGGAREWADDVFFCRGHKKTSEQSELCSDVVAEGGFEPPKLTQQIYSLPPLATRELLHMELWSWWTDSNPRPADYKSAALPAELHQRMYVVSVQQQEII